MGYDNSHGVLAKMSQAEVLHNFRKEIDATINHVELLIKDLDWNKGTGRELALVKTKLQEAKMWVGKALEVSGHPLPPEFADKANQ